MANHTKKIEEISQNNWVRIIKGSVLAMILSIIMLVVLGLLLAYTGVPESIISQAIIVISAISILVGSFISSMKIKKQGIINGGIVGAIYIIALYLLSSLVQNDFGVNNYAITMMVASILARMPRRRVRSEFVIGNREK